MSITFNGTLSDDLGVIVERIPNPQIASRRANTEVVPGRNGVLLKDDGSFATAPAIYEMHISAEGGKLFTRASRKVAAWLLSKAGFLRLEDSYEPDVFRLAHYNGGIDITSYFRDHGRFVCSFECQPQRYLKIGESVIRVQTFNDAGSGQIRISPIPYGIVALTVVGDAEAVYRSETGAIIGEITSDTPVPEGAVSASISWPAPDKDKLIQVFGLDSEDYRELLFGVNGALPVLYNPTQFVAMPLMKFVDTAQAPTPVLQTLSMREDMYINVYGETIEPADPSLLGAFETSEPVSVSGNAYAIVSGNGYAFLDENGNTKRGGFVYTGGRVFNQTTIIVPSWAASVVVSNRQGETSALSLQGATPNPGNAAVTINGVEVNLDFTEHNTIYLDCDLHNACYEDGSSANSAVSFSSSVVDYPTFPGLDPGENVIIVGDSENMNFEIEPRWWTL